MILNSIEIPVHNHPAAEPKYPHLRYNDVPAGLAQGRMIVLATESIDDDIFEGFLVHMSPGRSRIAGLKIGYLGRWDKSEFPIYHGKVELFNSP